MVDAAVLKEQELNTRLVRGTCRLVAFDDCKVQIAGVNAEGGLSLIHI